MRRLYAIVGTFLTVVLICSTPAHATQPTEGVPASGPSGLSAPIVSASAVNTTEVTVTWTASAGTVTNYSVAYARFYGLEIAERSAGHALVYNVTGLAIGLTYYFTVWAWNGTTQGPPSNAAPAQTDLATPPATPFPWNAIDTLTTLSILGSLAVSVAISSYVAGRRSRRAEDAAALALARSGPRARQPGRDAFRAHGRTDWPAPVVRRR